MLTTSKTKPQGESGDVGYQIVIKNSVDTATAVSQIAINYRPPAAENIIGPFSRFAAITQKK